MGLRLVNTAPGEVVDPIKPGQLIHMGLKSETLSVQLATTTVDIGLSSFAHTNVLPEDNTVLPKIGVTQAFETSERRRPITGTVSKSLSGSSIVLTKTSNSLGEQGIYELTIPIHPGDSILGYFKFRKKTAWVPYNPDWCNLTNTVGMYFGIEHGTFNTAAYAFLRNNGSGGSIVFAGPLQSFNTTRPGQVELATDLDPVAGGNQGWMSLADNAELELFIRINTFVSPFRAELWTRIAATPAPVFQGSILLGSLGQFPNSVFSNSRPGTSETATLFFGNIGRSGDILQLDDWALFPDYRTNVKLGEPTADAGRNIVPDLPIRFDSEDGLTPTEVTVARWFPSGVTPTPSFFFQPGRHSKPIYLVMHKSALGEMLYKRTEPRLEERLDGVMFEAFMAGASITRIGDLVGPGFSIQDGQKEYKVTMLETPTQKYYGIYSTGSQTALGSYYLTPDDVDFRSLKLVRLVIDRRRDKVALYIDEKRVIEEPISTVAQINSGVQGLPTIGLGGTTLTIDVSTNGGGSWTSQSHTFVANVGTVISIVNALNGDVAWTGAGPTQIEAIDRGDTFGIRTIQRGANMALRVNGASTAIGTNKLNLTVPSTTFGADGVFPAAPDSIGRTLFGHPFAQLYDAELHLSKLSYLSRYLAWESEDSLLPDSAGLETARRFTIDLNGTGESTMVSGVFTITKAEFSNPNSRRFYKKTQAFTNVGGIQLDFGVHVMAYTDNFGQVGAPNTAIDAGVVFFLGDKRVSFNFFDCGTGGKRVGIIPGSGSPNDILNLTPLGLSHSAAVDWTQPNLYRIIIQAFKGIEVWSGTVLGEPIISIPWRNDTDGFDLPADITAPTLAFGHFNHFSKASSSSTVWQYLRWGHSNGYEMALEQKYPNGLKHYLFGGKAFIYSDFDEA